MTCRPSASGREIRHLARNGYEVLAEFDRNGDHVIDRDDPIFARLRLWHDRNRNGVSEAAELTSLTDEGITAISVRYSESRYRDAAGNRFAFRARVYSAVPPHQRFSYDVYPVGMPVQP